MDNIIKYEFEDGTVINITVKALFDFKKTKETVKHQKKVIDRLSRKIQRLTKTLGIISCSMDTAHERTERLLSQNIFLMKRENKLQQIEQMFASKVIDLHELERIVNEK